MLKTHDSKSATPEQHTLCFEASHAADAPGIMFEKLDGTRHWAAYSFLSSIDYDGTVTITLHFTTGDITIVGKNLDSLWESLVLQKLTKVREMVVTERALEKPCVTAITKAPAEKSAFFARE